VMRLAGLPHAFGADEPEGEYEEPEEAAGV
jgi:hypothetical protein